MSDFKRIAEIAKVRRGASPRPINDPKWFGGDVGWVRIVDVTRSRKYLNKTEQYLSPLGESRSVRVTHGDLIMSICATIGRPVIIDMAACIHDGFVQFYDINGADTEYLYYALQHAEGEFLQLGQHGTQANLNTTLVGNHTLFLPPLPEQRKIASILTTVDRLIEQTEALIEKYRRVKQGMMADLLSRGVDENGKLRPTQEQAPQLYKQSDLGWIPKEWEVERLGTISEKIQDGTHFSPKSTDGPYRYITSKNIRFGRMDISNCEWISKNEHDPIYRRCDVRYGDVLLTKDGANTGNATLNTLREAFSLLSSVAFIRANPSHATNPFIVQYLLSVEGQQRMKDLMAGNAITRLTLVKIRGFSIPVPPMPEQLKLVAILNSFDASVASETSRLQKLRTLKTGLMQDLLTGKVRVKVDKDEETTADV